MVRVHGLSCPEVCGIFLDRGLNPCPVHWQAVPNHLDPRGRVPVVKGGWESSVSVLCGSSFFSGICSFFLFIVWEGVSSVQTPERVHLSMGDHLGGAGGPGKAECLECCGLCASGRSRPGAVLSVPARPSAAGWREAGTWSLCNPETAGHVVLK